jgi:uncharacterized membrane protein (UPF0182 family)
LLPAVFVLLVAIGMIAGYLEKWLWMRELNYTGIFWTLFSVRWIMFIAAFICFFLYLWINLREAVRVLTNPGATSSARRGMTLFRAGMANQFNIDFSPRLLNWGIVFGGAVVAWVAADALSSQWDTWLRFRYGGSFGVPDPLFGIDVGFYIFRLPFYQLLQTSVMLLTVVAIGAVSCIYGYIAVLRNRLTGGGIGRKAMSHLSILLFILVADWGFGFWLSHYELVYSTVGVVYGAGFTADHVTRIALWIMLALSVAGCALLALNVYRPYTGRC